MSDADQIQTHVEAIIAELVDAGLRDPAWIANAYIERIDPKDAGSDQRSLRCLCPPHCVPTARDCPAKGTCIFGVRPLH